MGPEVIWGKYPAKSSIFSGFFCGSSTVPQYIVDEINALGGDIQNAYGISKDELRAAIPCGIRKINVDTDIRLAVTRNLRELFRDCPALRDDPVVGPVWRPPLIPGRSCPPLWTP